MGAKSPPTREVGAKPPSYRPRMRVGKDFTPVCVCVCVCVCLSVYPSDNFWTAWLIDLMFSMQVGHYHIYTEFWCESREVKVTAVKIFIFFSRW